MIRKLVKAVTFWLYQQGFKMRAFLLAQVNLVQISLASKTTYLLGRAGFRNPELSDSQVYMAKVADL